MIAKFNVGDKKTFSRKVRKEDFAEFESGIVHPFYATFALGRDAEWTGRLFVLEMKDADEEGIGTYLTVEHKSPALLNQVVQFEAEITKMEGNTIECRFEARVGDRLIAVGTIGQKILKKDQVARIQEKAHEQKG